MAHRARSFSVLEDMKGKKTKMFYQRGEFSVKIDKRLALDNLSDSLRFCMQQGEPHISVEYMCAHKKLSFRHFCFRKKYFCTAHTTQLVASILLNTN